MEDKFIQLLKYATVKEIKDFISKKAPINLHYPTPDLETPLTAAIKRNDPQILTFLIEKNPTDLDATLTYPCGRTVLMYAAFVSRSPDILQILIKKGANPQKIDIRGWTCLEYAIIGERSRNVIFLLNQGQYVNQSDFDGRTPIMICVYLSNTEILSLLLNRGANVSAQDKHGLTALQLAILWRKRDAAIILMENGSDLTIITSLTKTTLGRLAKTTMPNRLRCIEEA